MTPDVADVVVVGGGIAGTSAAAFLAAAGASVVLVERDGLASGASGANSGVVQHPFDPVLVALYRETVTLYRDLAAESREFRFGGRPAGLLYISASETAVRGQAAAIEAAFPELGAVVLAGEELRAAEPLTAPGLWACRVDIGYPVVPSASTYAYATLAERHGAVVRTGRAAMLEVVGDAVTGVRVDGRRITAGAVIAAAGPWTPSLLDPTGGWTPIRPRWGVVVEVKLPVPTRHVLEEAGIEAVLDAATATGGAASAGSADAMPPVVEEPSPDTVEFSIVPTPGASSVGSTFLAREPDPAAWIEPVLVRAATFIPAISDAPIRGVRACARPECDDGRPLVGAVPGRRNLYVCAGHGPWGISTGPASARMVADLVLGRPAGIPPALDPARLGGPGQAPAVPRP